ncbi:MAG: hypothetical protein WC842_01565 [Candidatus Paceibacterota bacterium]|jgi:hypothetical protein
MGRSFITPCFSDWTKEVFIPGPMKIINGKRTDYPIRRAIESGEEEGIDWYRKTDPNFKKGTYSRCHKALRLALRPGDTLFFRTLWRGTPYLIGYFGIIGKIGDLENPVCVTDVTRSKCVDFLIPIGPGMVLMANEKTKLGSRHFNKLVNEYMGRSYLELLPGVATCFKHYIDLVDYCRKENQKLYPLK